MTNAILPASTAATLKNYSDFLPGFVQLRAIVSLTENFLLYTGVSKQPEVKGHYDIHLAQENNTLNIALVALPLICLAATYCGMKTNKASALFVIGNLFAMEDNNAWSAKAWNAYQQVAHGKNPVLNKNSEGQWQFDTTANSSCFFNSIHPLHKHFVTASLKHDWKSVFALLETTNLFSNAQKHSLRIEALKEASRQGVLSHQEELADGEEKKQASSYPISDDMRKYAKLKRDTLSLNLSSRKLTEDEKTSPAFLLAFANLQTPKETKRGVGFFMDASIRNEELQKTLFKLNLDCDAFLYREESILEHTTPAVTQEEISPAHNEEITERIQMMKNFKKLIPWMLKAIDGSTESTYTGKRDAKRKILSELTPSVATDMIKTHNTLTIDHWPDQHMNLEAWTDLTIAFEGASHNFMRRSRLVEAFPSLTTQGNVPEWANLAYELIAPDMD